MAVTADQMQLRRILKDVWPGLWPELPDRTVLLPNLEQVQTLMGRTWLERYRYQLERFDCDDFALVAHAFVVQERYKSGDQHGWAFGQVRGLFDGAVTGHAMNWVVTDDKVVRYVEPQDDSVRRADPADVIWRLWL